MARTETTLSWLVETLQSNCGDMYGACRVVGVSPIFVRTWMKDDPKVAEALQEAERVGGMAIESEAIRRAVRGYDEDVYFKGKVVGQKTVYSDGLMQTLLKGRPGLRERYTPDDNGGITVNGGQVQINQMPRANSYQEWLQMREATVARNKVSDEAVAAHLLMAPAVIDVTPTPALPNLL